MPWLGSKFWGSHPIAPLDFWVQGDTRSHVAQFHPRSEAGAGGLGQWLHLPQLVAGGLLGRPSLLQRPRALLRNQPMG